MIEILEKVIALLNVPEASRDHLFKNLIPFSISEDIADQYDNIRSCERKGMNKREILIQLQNGGFDHLRAEHIFHEYRSIRKVTNIHRGKRKFVRGLPILFLGVMGFISVYFFRNQFGIKTLGPLCIVSFICIIISSGATFGGILQIITGWD